MKRLWTHGLMALIVVMLLAVNATAASVLMSGPSPATYGYGHPQWTNFSGALDAATGGQITVAPGFHDLNLMMAHDAIFLNLRSSQVIDPIEMTNISTFMGTGRKVVLMGENSIWTGWNNQILSTVGGVYAGQYLGPPPPPAGPHPLTAGVGPVTVLSAGTAAGPGLPLFAVNWATLWGDNVLTLLDSNAFDNIRWAGSPNNTQFGMNVAAWIADSNPVPIPGAIWLLGSGLAGLLALRRRLQ